MQVVKVTFSTVLMVCLSAQKVWFTSVIVDNHRVTVHDEEGMFLFAFGSKGNGPGCFDGPGDVTFGSDGLVYVTERWEW